MVTVSGAQGNVCYSTSAAVTSCSSAETIPTGTNAGNYTVYWYVAGNTNYSSKSGSVTVTIGEYNLSNATIASVSSQTYTGSQIKPTPAVTVPLPSGSTTTLTVTTDYTYSYTNNTNAGTATITVTGTGNYTGTKTSTFTIGKKSLTVPSQSGSLTYNKASQSPSWSNYNTTWMTIGGTTSGTNATSYNATFTLKDTTNTQWSDGTTAAKTVTWSIGKYNLSNATIASVSSQTYTGSQIKPTPAVTVPLPSGSTTTLTVTTDYTYSYTNNTNIGTATVTVTGTGNYTGTKTKTFSIVDTTKPVCTFGSWTSSSISPAESNTIVLTCTDSGSGVSTTSLASTDFTLGGTGSVDVGTITAGGTTASRTFTITVTGSGIGTVTLTLPAGKVSDASSNTNEAATSGTLTVIDTTPPGIEFTPNSNTTAAKSHTVTVSASDDSTISTLKYLWTQTNGASASEGTSFTSGQSITKDTGDGIWYLCVYAKDSANNSTNQCSGQFTFDNTGPQINSQDTIYAKEELGADLTAMITATDTYSSNPTLSIKLNGSAITNTSSLTQGKYTLSVTATDDLGNSNSKNIDLIIYFLLQDKCDGVTTTSGYTGLFKDQTNSNRCIYRGGSNSTVNNYLKFADDSSYDWRIIGVEADGTLKIIKETSIGAYKWHDGTTATSRTKYNNAQIKTYVDNYYNELSTHKKGLIALHTFNIGEIYVSSESSYTNVYLASSSTNSETNKEDDATMTSYIGLINASDLHKAYRTSSGSGCSSTSFIKACAGTTATNWLYPTTPAKYWTGHVLYRGILITNASGQQSWGATVQGSLTETAGTRPVVFLKDSVAVYGSGTTSDPYVPVIPPISPTTCTITATPTGESISGSNYSTEQTLTVTPSDSGTFKYSFDGVTFTTSPTKAVSAAGTHTAYIQDSDGLMNQCSITLKSRPEYRNQTCNKILGTSWWAAGTEYSASSSLISYCVSKNTAEQNGYTHYHECNTINSTATCQELVGTGNTCYSKTTYYRNCTTGTSCDAWGDWDTTEKTSSCGTNVETRTTYAPQ